MMKLAADIENKVPRRILALELSFGKWTWPTAYPAWLDLSSATRIRVRLGRPIERTRGGMGECRA
jgi:hypothetical protein